MYSSSIAGDIFFQNAFGDHSEQDVVCVRVMIFPRLTYCITHFNCKINAFVWLNTFCIRIVLIAIQVYTTFIQVILDATGMTQQMFDSYALLIAPTFDIL